MTIGRQGHDAAHLGHTHGLGGPVHGHGHGSHPQGHPGLAFAPRLPPERHGFDAERDRGRHSPAPGSAAASSPASAASASTSTTMHRRPTNPNYGAPLTALLPLLQRGGRNGQHGAHRAYAAHTHPARDMSPYTRPLTHPRHPSATSASATASGAASTAASPAAGPSTSASTPSGSARPVQRSRNGCYTCRKRKVKCDERTPICIKCEYSGRSCEWPPEDPVIRRKNRPRKMKLHLTDTKPATSSPPAAPPPPPPPLSEDAKRTLRVPIHALQAFAATLPKLPQRGYETGPAGIAGTMAGMQGLKGLREKMMPRRLRANLMTDAAFLAPYFPQVDERLIFRHFIHHTAALGLARDDPDPKRTWNPWVSLLAPLAFVHLPGESPAGDALRAALLAIGSVHLHYLSDPLDAAGAGRIIALARPSILGLVRTSISSITASSPTPPSDIELDLILGALLGLVVASALSADPTWHSLLRDVVSLLADLGGAPHLLATAPKDRLGVRRFVLEQLAVRDTLGCMAEIAGGGEPMLLKAGRDRAFATAFFDAAAWSATDEEWESVERAFGVSRGLVDLIAKTSTLVAHVRGSQADAEAAGSSPNATTSPTNTAPAAPTSGTSGATGTSGGDAVMSEPNANAASGEAGSGGNSGAAGADPNGGSEAQAAQGNDDSLEAEADSLMAELKVWDESAKFSPWHQRTAYGNAAHRHALTIRLIRDVFNCPASDRRVQAAAKAVLELAVEAVSTFGNVVWLAWPVVLAACQLSRTDPARDTVMNLLGGSSVRACFDLDAARHLVVAHWRRCDVEAAGESGKNGRKA